MAEPFKARYTELKIRPQITEAEAVAEVTFGSQAGTVEIAGLPADLDINDLGTFSEGVYTDIESMVGPAELERLLARNPEVVITDVSGTEEEGRLLRDHRRDKPVLCSPDGTVSILPNERMIGTIQLKEKLRADSLLRVAYSKEGAESDKASLAINHLLEGLSFGGIVYELGFGEGKLGLSPFVYVSNKSSLDFDKVKLTLVMPEKPKPQGERIRPEISPLEQYLARSEDISFKERPILRRAYAGEPEVAFMAASAEAPEEARALYSMVVPEETIEGTVAAVDTEGSYSLQREESKKVRLTGVMVDEPHRAKVFLLNPSKYTQGTFYTSIIEAVRFTPDADLKAGSFYFDGQQLEFPAMKKGQEYELGLRSCRNLEAQVTKEESSKQDERGRQVVSLSYKTELINNTGEDQTVELNIPLEPIMTGRARNFVPAGGEGITYQQKEIAGEQYQVAEIKVKAKSTVGFGFCLEEA